MSNKNVQNSISRRGTGLLTQPCMTANPCTAMFVMFVMQVSRNGMLQSFSILHGEIKSVWTHEEEF